MSRMPIDASWPLQIAAVSQRERGVVGPRLAPPRAVRGPSRHSILAAKADANCANRQAEPVCGTP